MYNLSEKYRSKRTLHSDTFIVLCFSVTVLNIKATCHKGQWFIQRLSQNCEKRLLASFCLSVQLGSHWTDILEIRYCRIFQKSVGKIQFPLESVKKSGYYIWRPLYIFYVGRLETRWAFNERWNNKFYYKVASCWLFLLSHTAMHGSMNIKSIYTSSSWHFGAAFSSKNADNFIFLLLHQFMFLQGERPSLTVV
jgi:hypothetical protein